jgi:serine/threonine protein kinase
MSNINEIDNEELLSVNSNNVISTQTGSYGTVEIRNDKTVMKKFVDKYTGMLLKEVSFLRMLNETVIKVDTNNKECKFIMPYLGIPLYKYCRNNKLYGDEVFIQSAMKQFLIKIMKYHKLGVFHCDLMDKNVLWDPHSETLNVIDFGLSILDINCMTEHFYEIYASYYKDPTRRHKDIEIRQLINTKQQNNEAYGEISNFLPVNYQDDIWAFGMYMYRMLVTRKEYKTDTNLCRIPEDVDVDWIASRIHIPRFAYIISKCFTNREDRPSAEDLLQLMPICANMGEIKILTGRITNLRTHYTLNYKDILSTFHKEKLENTTFYLSRISVWFNKIGSSNWVAKCVALNMIIKFLEKDGFIYKNIDEVTKFRKQRYINLIIGMISCLTLEMFGDSGLTRIFHQQFGKYLDTLYNDIIKSLFPNYIYFPIYKNYHKDLTNYTTYLLIQNEQEPKQENVR